MSAWDKVFHATDLDVVYIDRTAYTPATIPTLLYGQNTYDIIQWIHVFPESYHATLHPKHINPKNRKNKLLSAPNFPGNVIIHPRGNDRVVYCFTKTDTGRSKMLLWLTDLKNQSTNQQRKDAIDKFLSMVLLLPVFQVVNGNIIPGSNIVIGSNGGSGGDLGGSSSNVHGSSDAFQSTYYPLPQRVPHPLTPVPYPAVPISRQQSSPKADYLIFHPINSTLGDLSTFSPSTYYLNLSAANVYDGCLILYEFKVKQGVQLCLWGPGGGGPPGTTGEYPNFGAFGFDNKAESTQQI